MVPILQNTAIISIGVENGTIKFDKCKPKFEKTAWKVLHNSSTNIWAPDFRSFHSKIYFILHGLIFHAMCHLVKIYLVTAYFDSQRQVCMCLFFKFTD